MANNIEQAYELTLVVRSQIGDESAFAELLRIYSPRLRFYVAKMLGERHQLVDDLLQDIWLSVFRALAKLNDPAAFRAWLFRIARDRVCREFRRTRVEFETFDEQQATQAMGEDESRERLDVDAVYLQLDTLSAAHREALVLRFVEDMSYEDIARVTGNTIGTVRSRIHYAKRALRCAFEEKTYEHK